jgi:hypothetical protein
MSMTIGARVASVLCDSPEWVSAVRVPPFESELARSFITRAQGELTSQGWTKDGTGQDRCPDCRAPKASS